MKYIPLGNSDLKAKVDDADFEHLSQYSWSLTCKRNRRYALRMQDGITVYMHREILGFTKGDGNVTDHINGDGLDNRRKNLRKATSSQNCAARRIRRTVEGYHGIVQADDGSYRIRSRSPQKRQIQYKTAKAAAKASDAIAREKYGEFAYLNFPRRYSYSTT